MKRRRRAPARRRRAWSPKSINRDTIFTSTTNMFKHPFTAIVAGPSGSGKTVFTTKLIEHVSQMILPPPQKILWCYGVYQNFFNDMKNVEFHDGLPDINSFDDKERTLLILDDL